MPLPPIPKLIESSGSESSSDWDLPSLCNAQERYEQCATLVSLAFPGVEKRRKELRHILSAQSLRKRRVEWRQRPKWAMNSRSTNYSAYATRGILIPQAIYIHCLTTLSVLGAVHSGLFLASSSKTVLNDILNSVFDVICSCASREFCRASIVVYFHCKS
jgi:hypothetical protein